MFPCFESFFDQSEGIPGAMVDAHYGRIDDCAGVADNTGPTRSS